MGTVCPVEGNVFLPLPLQYFVMKCLPSTLLLLLLFSVICRSQSTYDRQQVSKWLQEGALDEVIKTANNTPQPDTFLLQCAGYAGYQTGDRSTASTYFNRLLALDSGNRQALYYSALLERADEHYAEAIP